MLLNPVTLAAESLPTLPKSPDRLEQQYTDAASAFVQINDARIHYREHGDPTDQTLLLVHGTYSSLHTWDDWTAALEDDYHVVRLGLPGFGLTGPRAEGEHTVPYLVETLGAFCDELGIDDIVYAGNSLGGGLGLRLAVARPDLLSGLILLDAGGGTLLCRIVDSLATPFVMQIALSRLAVRGLINDAFASANSPSSETVRRYYDLVRRRGNRPAVKELAHTFRSDHPEDCERRQPVPRPPSFHTTSPEICDAVCARNVEIPTLLQWGCEDNWLPPAFGRELETMLADSRFQTYENVGHVPMEEAPDRTVSDARTFLDNIDTTET